MTQGAVYRRRQVGKACLRGEQAILRAIEPVLQSRFKSLSRELRKANLRKRLAKNDGKLFKVENPDYTTSWRTWESQFTSTLTGTFTDGFGYVWDAEQSYWISHDYPVFPFSEKEVLRRYLSNSRDGSRITNIASDTEVRVNEIISEWYTTDESLPQLIDRLTALFGRSRAELIATTEMNYIASQVAKEQMKEYGIKEWIWDAFTDGYVCDKCLSLMQQSKIHPFTLQDPFPPDPSHPRCVLPGQIVFAPNLAGGAKSFYEGLVVEITTKSGHVLSVTPNHPVLTSRGWVAAHLLNVGGNVIQHIDPQRMSQGIRPYDEQRPALIEDVFASLKMTPGMVSVTMKPAAEDFNGDAFGVKGEVDIVFSDRELGYRMQSNFIEQFRQVSLDGVHFPDALDTLGMGELEVKSLLRSPDSVMRGFSLSKSSASRHFAPFDSLGFALSSALDAVFEQGVLDDFSVNAPFLSEFVFRNAFSIKRDEIVGIRKYDFSGHVYDLSSDFYEFYICNGVITHNCRCGVYYVGVDAKVKKFAGGWRTFYAKGGRGSGNFGHAGRPGNVGGSSAGGHGGGVTNVTIDDRARAVLANTFLKDEKGVNEFCKTLIPAGYTGSFEVQEGSDGSVRVYVYIRNETNDVIMDGKYIIRPDGIVKYDGVEVAKEYQGQGIGKEVFEAAENFFIESGAKGVSLTAGDSVGGYAWARLGFDFANEESKLKITNVAENAWDTGYFKMRRALGDTSYEFQSDYTKMPEFTHTWELASMSSPWDDRFGRTTMLGSQWDGFKDLSANSLGIIIGDAYYAADK